MTSQEAVIIAGNPDPLPYRERHSPKPTAVGQPPGPSPLLGQPNSRCQPPTPPTIVDGCTDLLALLDPRRRRGMIAWLSVRYYDGYRPCRAEIADLVAVSWAPSPMTKAVHGDVPGNAATTGLPTSPPISETGTGQTTPLTIHRKAIHDETAGPRPNRGR